MREAFALQSVSQFFIKKYWRILDINVLNFNETLTNDVVSFEQPGPDILDAIKSRDRHKSLGNDSEYKYWQNKVTKLIKESKKSAVSNLH